VEGKSWKGPGLHRPCEDRKTKKKKKREGRNRYYFPLLYSIPEVQNRALSSSGYREKEKERREKKIVYFSNTLILGRGKDPSLCVHQNSGGRRRGRRKGEDGIASKTSYLKLSFLRTVINGEGKKTIKEFA